MNVLPRRGYVTVTLETVEKVTPLDELDAWQRRDLRALLRNRLTDFTGEAQEVASIQIECISGGDESALMWVAYRPGLKPLEIFPEASTPLLG